MHKTGSTTIQSYLFRHLRSPSAVYADLCGDFNHSPRMFSLFSGNAAGYHLNRTRGWGPAEIARYNEASRSSLLASIRDSGQADFIISGEDISMLDEEGLCALKSFLAQHFPAIVIAGYVRAPHSYMDSDFQQRVKGTLARLNAGEHYPNYRVRFEKFDRVFGRQNVLLWKFDPKSFPDGCVVSDFGSRLGIPVDSTKVVRSNESLSRNALALLFAYRKFGRGFAAGPGVLIESERLNAALAQIRGNKARLSPRLVAPVLAAQRRDIAWIEERVGASFSDEPADEKQDDIVSEQDLLRIAPEAMEQLRALIGQAGLPSAPQSETPEYAALLVEALRSKLGKGKSPPTRPHRDEGPANRVRTENLTATELVERMKAAKPSLLDEMPEKRAAALIHHGLVQLGKHLEGVEDGVVNVPGLGRFVVARVEEEQDGENKTTKRVRFLGLAKAGPEKA
jgi:hypothetical protein